MSNEELSLQNNLYLRNERNVDVSCLPHIGHYFLASDVSHTSDKNTLFLVFYPHIQQIQFAYRHRKLFY